MKIFSLIGSFTTIAVLFMLNYFTSWSHPWFLYPSFAILWWPIAMFPGSNHPKALSIIGSMAAAVSLIIINLIVSPSEFWFHYLIFIVIWWPLSVFFANKQTIKGFSGAGALIIISFLTLINYMESPAYLWAPLAYFPALMWPAAALLGKRLNSIGGALCGSLSGILYYAVMNAFFFPGFPWIVFPAYALLWWPIAVAFAKQARTLLFSVAGVLLSTAFFITVNLITSPTTVWAVYPIFALVWWPLSTYYFIYRSKKIIQNSSVQKDFFYSS